MTDKQFKIFNKHAGTYCTAKVKSPGEDTFYPQEYLAKNPRDRKEIEELLDGLNEDDLAIPKYKDNLDCLKSLLFP